MRMELEYQWDLVEEDVPERFETLQDTFVSLLEDLKTSIRGKWSHWGVPLEDRKLLTQKGSKTIPEHFVKSLVQGIDAQVENVEYKLQREQRNFATEVK